MNKSNSRFADPEFRDPQRYVVIASSHPDDACHNNVNDIAWAFGCRSPYTLRALEWILTPGADPIKALREAQRFLAIEEAMILNEREHRK